jgi:UDP-3-O-[3-hydroxymyristoyl] glucosamine N-acyltransferase
MTGPKMGKEVIVGKNVHFGKDVVIWNYVAVGDNTKMDDGTKIGSFCDIGVRKTLIFFFSLLFMKGFLKLQFRRQQQVYRQ